MGKPEWRPENAYDDQNPEMYYAFDEGAQAMAKALIERIEELAEGPYDFPFLVGNPEWESLKREALGEVASEGE